MDAHRICGPEESTKMQSVGGIDWGFWGTHKVLTNQLEILGEATRNGQIGRTPSSGIRAADKW